MLSDTFYSQSHCYYTKFCFFCQAIYQQAQFIFHSRLKNCQYSTINAHIYRNQIYRLSAISDILNPFFIMILLCYRFLQDGFRASVCAYTARNRNRAVIETIFRQQKYASAEASSGTHKTRYNISTCATPAIPRIAPSTTL